MGPDRIDSGRAHPAPRRERVEDASLVATLFVLSVSVFDGGGFADGWRIGMALVAAADLVLVTVLRPELVSVSIRRPAVLALILLSTLGVLSLIWAPLPAREILPAALLPAALAALAVYGSVVLRGRRVVWFGYWLAAVAVLVAISGLAGVAFKSEIWAKILGGSRRPAGAVEYTTALVLLQVGATVILLRLAGGRRPGVRFLGAAGMSLGVGSVILAQNRLLGLAMGLLLLTCVLWPGRSLGLARSQALGLALSAALGGAAVAAVFELFGAGGGTLVLAICLAAAWGVGTALSGDRTVASEMKREEALTRPWSRIAVVFLALLGILALTLTVGDERSRKGIQTSQGFSHGRVDTWVDSVPTFLREPLSGHGQGTYLTATAMDLKSPTRYPHNFLVESSVELGIVGLLAALVLVADSLRLAWSRRRSHETFQFLPYFLGFVLLMFTDWVWHMPAMSAIWALAAGALLATGARRYRDRQPG